MEISVDELKQSIDNITKEFEQNVKEHEERQERLSKKKFEEGEKFIEKHREVLENLTSKFKKFSNEYDEMPEEGYLAEDINNIIKFFYKQQVKTHLGSYNISKKDNSWMNTMDVQLSKKGIGWAHRENGNIKKLSKLFKGELSYYNFFKCEDLFNDIKDNLSDEGQIKLEELKTILFENKIDEMERKDQHISKDKQFKLKELIGDTYKDGGIFGYGYTHVKDSNSIALTNYENGIIINDSNGYSGSGFKPFNYYRDDDDLSFHDELAAKIITIFFEEEINKLIDKNDKERKKFREGMKIVKEEIVNRFGKYILANKI